MRGRPIPQAAPCKPGKGSVEKGPGPELRLLGEIGTPATWGDYRILEDQARGRVIPVATTAPAGVLRDGFAPKSSMLVGVLVASRRTRSRVRRHACGSGFPR